MAVNQRQSRELSRFDDGVLSQLETIRRIGFRLLNDRQDLDDFTQEVVLRVYANRDRLRDVGCLTGYIRVAAQNTAQSWNRKRKPILMDSVPELPFEPPPEETLDGDERWSALLAALSSLSETDQAILRAFYFDEQNTRQLEQRFAVSSKALSARLTRARQRLRACGTTIVSGIGYLLFPVRKARCFGELPARMTTMRSAVVLTTCLAVLGGAGTSWYVSAETVQPPVVVEKPLRPVELVEQGGGISPKPSPLMAQAPAAPFQAMLDGKWTTKAEMLDPRTAFVTGVVDGKIYAIGGTSPTSLRTSVDVYDPIADMWTRRGSEMPQWRSYMSSAVVNGKIYVIGGWSSIGTDQYGDTGRTE